MKKKFVASMFALALAAATIAPTVAHAEKKPGIQDGSVLWKTTGNTKTDFGLSLNYEDALKPSPPTPAISRSLWPTRIRIPVTSHSNYM